MKLNTGHQNDALAANYQMPIPDEIWLEQADLTLLTVSLKAVCGNPG
jgi:hypothetical protein